MKKVNPEAWQFHFMASYSSLCLQDKAWPNARAVDLETFD